jgi:hypothetical protein
MSYSDDFVNQPRFLLSRLGGHCNPAMFLLKEFVFKFCDVLEEHVTVAEEELVLVGQISSHRWEKVFVHDHDGIECSFSDLQGWQMRQEVISNEETQENKVIDDTLKVEAEPDYEVLKLKEQILTDYCNLDKLKLSDLSESSRVVSVVFSALINSVTFLATF